jgi:phosphate transport system substrate-binding protein
MKKITIYLLLVVAIVSVSGVSCKARKAEKQSITLSGAWALYPMAVKWAEEYQKLNPGMKVEVSAGGAGKGMADCLAGVVDIGMISREISAEEVAKGAWWVSVVKDAVIPTVHAENPAIDQLLANGMTRDAFAGIWRLESITAWGQAAGTTSSDAINVYTRSDACGAASTWAEYLGCKQEDLKGVGVFGDPGLAEAVRKDRLGIGYNNINYAYDASTKAPVEGIRVVPIDINANGKIDPEEDFYADRESLVKAIADGRFPSPPARALHFASKGRPQDPAVLAFIRWVLTDGQKFVPEGGYINLKDDVLQEQIKKLD